jgi:hypothetical protein
MEETYVKKYGKKPDDKKVPSSSSYKKVRKYNAADLEKIVCP